MIRSLICAIFGHKPVAYYYDGRKELETHICGRCGCLLGTRLLPGAWSETGDAPVEEAFSWSEAFIAESQQLAERKARKEAAELQARVGEGIGVNRTPVTPCPTNVGRLIP